MNMHAGRAPSQLHTLQSQAMKKDLKNVLRGNQYVLTLDGKNGSRVSKRSQLNMQEKITFYTRGPTREPLQWSAIVRAAMLHLR